MFLVSPTTLAAEAAQTAPPSDEEGDEGEDAPAEEFRTEHVLAQATSDDVPDDIFAEFGEWAGLMFVSYDYSHIRADRLKDALDELETRGYTMVREEPDDR